MAKREMKLDPNYNPAVKAMLDTLVLHVPGVQVGKAFGYPAYKIYGKVFAFVGGDGASFKLPVARGGELLAQGNAALRPFEPAEGIVWKEWVKVSLPDPEMYRDYTSLLDESIQYVAGGGR